MQEIDETQAYITLADGSCWQVLDDEGYMDPLATQAAIDAYLVTPRETPSFMAGRNSADGAAVL